MKPASMNVAMLPSLKSSLSNVKAMKLNDLEALSSIRFSLGRFTTAQEIERSIEFIKAAAKKLG